MSLTRQGFMTSGAAAFATIGIISPARAADFSLKWAVDVPAEHPITVACIQAFSDIGAATKGRVQIKAFPASVLGGDQQMLAQLRSGALEMLALPGAFLNAVVPVASIENVAYAFRDRDEAFRAMDGDLGAVVRGDIQAQGMHVFERIWESGFREITTSSKPIRNVSDIAGLRIRVSPGKIRLDTFQSLGAAPTPIAVSELYTALQTHVVDAEENPLLLIEQQKFYEVQKYVSLSHHIWSGYWNLVNGDVWNRLPPDVQTVVARELDAAALRARSQTDALTKATREQLTRRGMQFNDVDVASFEAKLKQSGYYQRWKGEFGSKAWGALERYANKLA